MTASEGIGRVLFGGVDEFLARGASRLGRKRVKHVDRDAQGRGAGDRRCDERDWSSEQVVLRTESFRPASVSVVVGGGKLVARPGMS